MRILRWAGLSGRLTGGTNGRAGGGGSDWVRVRTFTTEDADGCVFSDVAGGAVASDMVGGSSACFAAR